MSECECGHCERVRMLQARIRDLEARLEAADRLADAVQEVAQKLREEYYAAPIQASEALAAVLTTYREARHG